MNNTYYFSHDANARNDEKILMLRAEHGWEGYGLYWLLVEMMFENKETCLKHSRIRGIAHGYNIDITVLESVINTAITEGLFVSNGEEFWSESLRRRKEAFEELREKRSRAGKKGMRKRWNKAEEQQSYNGVITKDNKGKESKVKESKVNSTNIYTPAQLEKIQLVWNEHQLTSLPQNLTKTNEAICKAIDDYGYDSVVTAIKNYSKILNNTDFLLDTKWQLSTFLEKHIEKFLQLEAAQNMYRKGGANGRAKGTNGTNRTKAHPGEERPDESYYTSGKYGKFFADKDDDETSEAEHDA